MFIYFTCSDGSPLLIQKEVINWVYVSEDTVYLALKDHSEGIPVQDTWEEVAATLIGGK